MDICFWQERYARGETGWDKGAAAPPLVDFLAETRPEGRVLVPGCGAGHDVRALASTGADVLGVDWAPEALAQATSFPVVGTERYLLADFLEMPSADAEPFDWIFEHTLFCAIHPLRRADYARACASLLRPGGRFLAIFYLNPRDPGDDESTPPFPCTIPELDTLFSPFFSLDLSSVHARSYPGREGRELLRLHTRRG